MALQLVERLRVAMPDPQRFFDQFRLYNGDRELFPALEDETWKCLCSLFNWTWTSFEEARTRQHDALHHPPPLADFLPAPLDFTPVPPSTVSFAQGASKAISAAQLRQYAEAINAAPLDMQIEAGFVAPDALEEDRFVVPNHFLQRELSPSPTPPPSNIPPPVSNKGTKRRQRERDGSDQDGAMTEADSKSKRPRRAPSSQKKGKGRQQD